MTNTILDSWTEATGNLPWGVHKVFHDVLSLAAEGKTTLIYGQDYRDSYPCLVNSVGAMLKVGGGQGVPTAHFEEVVSIFDEFNRHMFKHGFNTRVGYVSEFSAGQLVKYFAPESASEKPDLTTSIDSLSYYEPKDEDLAREMVELFTMPCAPVDPDESLKHVHMKNDNLHAVLNTYSDSDDNNR